MECKYFHKRSICQIVSELIDTLWNVNLLYKINICTIYELIDTLWNVNVADIFDVFSSDDELIDTLWNVNGSDCIMKQVNILELIDTLWNVNSKYINSFCLRSIRINRYIMECK